MAENNNFKPRQKMGPGMGPRVAEKPKNFKNSVLKMIKFMKPYMVSLVIALFMSVISSVISIIGPDKLREITNEITASFMTGINLSKITNIALILVFLYSFSLIIGYIQGFIMATITNKTSKRLRTGISEKINKLPLKYFDNTSFGDVLSRVTNDVDTIAQTLNNSIDTLVSSVTLFVGTTIMMFVTNWIMALVAIVSTFIGFSLLVVILSKSQKYFAMQQEELGNLNGHIEEIYSGHNVVKAYNAVDDANEEFDKINERLYYSARKSRFLAGLMQPIMEFTGNFGYVTVCITGAILVMNNTVGFGAIVAFMIYVRLFSGPLRQMAQAASQLQTAAAASERVFEFLEEKEMPDESHKTKVLEPSKVLGEIEFKNVKFGYDENKTIIKDFSVLAKPGQKVAIVGPTGAGKTTMVNLLMRFYEINSGTITIDGISTQELTRENIHKLFIMVLQDTWLFNGTIKENIIYNKENVSFETVEKACKTVGLDHFIKTLPKGYDTVLNDVDNLSQGQKQLLTIARGMIEDAPFLILDEATSSVDTRTEVLVQNAMDKLTEGRTSFIIAHRLSTIKNADIILVMNEGNIIEQGNHEELLAKNGFYAKLYNSQFENVG